MLNDRHVLETIPAYVLGSLDEAETRQVAEHLAGCYLCRKELETYQDIADQLLLAVPPATPPAQLKSRLAERVQRLNHKRVPDSAARRLPGRLVPVGAIAGLLLILLLAISNILFWRQAHNSEVFTGPLGMRAVALQNTTAVPEASAIVIISADGKNGVLVVDQLETLSENQEYQVWLERDSTETSGGLFGVDEDGYRGMRIVAPESLLTYSSVRVTIEPKGGSSRPTGPEVLKGSLFNSRIQK
ncbi:MAG TPA: anti-sigma factor [Anaerolineales bacterium]|nr:anti-sigma factor [Anaerolineales bacterium]